MRELASYVRQKRSPFGLKKRHKFVDVKRNGASINSPDGRGKSRSRNQDSTWARQGFLVHPAERLAQRSSDGQTFAPTLDPIGR